ncbi:hypothetical protein Tco_1478438, partial [Tanacetum coccineum]
MELQLKNNFREALETTSKKKKHYKTKHALNIIDEEFKEDKFEATTKIRNLAKVYGAWLPPWLAARLVVYQPYVKNESKEFLYIQGRICDQDARYALSQLLQRGTVTEYEMALQVEAFSLARIIETRFEAIAHEEKATAEKKQSIKETTDTITSLQSDVASLKEKGSLD